MQKKRITGEGKLKKKPLGFRSKNSIKSWTAMQMHSKYLHWWVGEFASLWTTTHRIRNKSVFWIIKLKSIATKWTSFPSTPLKTPNSRLVSRGRPPVSRDWTQYGVPEVKAINTRSVEGNGLIGIWNSRPDSTGNHGSWRNTADRSMWKWRSMTSTDTALALPCTRFCLLCAFNCQNYYNTWPHFALTLLRRYQLFLFFDYI